VLRSGVPRTFPGRTVEVGTGGLSLVVAADLFAGEPVGVVLELPGGGEPIQSRGRVCYQDRLHAGVQFVLPSRVRVDLIQQWAVTTQATAVSKVEIQRSEPQAPRFLDRSEPHSVAPELRRKRWLPVSAAVVVLTVAGLLALSLWALRPARTPASASHLISTRIIVPPEIMRSQVLQRTVPEYPEAARRNGIEGVVALVVVVDKSGRVIELRRLNGPQVLLEAAEKAVQQWRFAPFLVGGEPVEVETTIDVGFRLTDK
jgi:TonB family protein